MRNYITMAALAVAAVAMLAGPSYAGERGRGGGGSQNGASSTVQNRTDVFTGVIVGGATGGVPGAAAAAASSGNSWNQPQLVMNSTSSSAPSTFNECGVSVNVNAWLFSYGESTEGVDCVAQRQAQAAMTLFQDPVMAMEVMCSSPVWNKADRTSGRNRCPEQRAAMAKQQAQQVSAAPAPVTVAAAPVLPADCKMVQPANYMTCQ